MTVPSVAFLEVDTPDIAAITAQFPAARIEQGVLAGDALIERCTDAEVISCFIHTRFSAEVFSRLPRLKLLCTRSVGYDHIDVSAAAERGIVACNVPDYGSHVIAEHVFALLLGTLRHVQEGSRRVAEGTFDYRGLRGMALKGKTIGILGTGKIGRAVAMIAHGFGMRILACDQCRNVDLEERYSVRYVEFTELLRQSDVVSLHVPATPETFHLFNEKALSTMKQGAVLVNTARGSLIDSEALLRALESGHLGWALLDVLEHEENFAVSKALVSRPRVVATPHIAFYADDSMKSMYDETFASIAEWQAGQPPRHTVQTQTVVCDLPLVKAS